MNLKVEVKFTIRKNISPGQKILITGNCKELGNWKLPLYLKPNENGKVHSLTLTFSQFCKVLFNYFFFFYYYFIIYFYY